MAGNIQTPLNTIQSENICVQEYLQKTLKLSFDKIFVLVSNGISMKGIARRAKLL